MLENRTEVEIEAKLKSLCPLLGPKYSFLCQILATQVPSYIAKVESVWDVTRVCGELKFCDVEVSENQADLQALQTYSLNFDLPPNQRWSQLCALPHVQEYWNQFISVVSSLLPEKVVKGVEDAGLVILELMDTELAEELRGCSTAAKTNLGWHALLNVAYELTDACTSIVAQTASGQILHARNLDFGSGGFLTATMRNVSAIVEMTSKGSVFARQTSFIGFVGILSGQSLTGGFTVTVNTRFYPGSPRKSFLQFLGEIGWAIENFPRANLAVFLSRNAVIRAGSFPEAVSMLSNTELVADIYYTVSGTKPGEGVVITRNRTGAANTWPLQSAASGAGSWFVLQTNYDHWGPAPWFDDRMGAGYDAMNRMGPNNVTLPNLLTVLTVRPVLNLLTSYSLLAANSNQSYTSVNRYCSYPCAL